MVRTAKVAVAQADAEEKKGEAAEQQERKLKLKLSTEKALLYGPMILLGPILPAVLAVINVVIGSAVLHGNPIDKTALQFCGAPLDRFVSASIAASYLFLIVFAWAFIGFEVTATIKGRRRILMRPFSSLPALAIAYMIPLLMSIVVWIYGSWTVSQGTFSPNCVSFNKPLLGFAVFLVVAYWIGLLYAVWSLVKQAVKRTAVAVSQGAVNKAKTARADYIEHNKQEVQDIEGQLLLEKFREFDTDQTGYIDGTELAALVKSVGVTLEGHQLQRAFAQMDKEGDNRIQFEEFLAWYRTTNAGEEAE